MTTIPRSLLVAAAVLATLLVGVRDTLGEVRVARGGECVLEGDSFRGSREDDSGTRSEQGAEDDDQEQDEREIHLFATSILAWRRDAAVGTAAVPRGLGSPRFCRDHARARGPPSA